MKRLLFTIFITTLSLSAFSQDRGLGVGVILGEPTGLSAKMWTGDNTAIDAAAAWSLAGQASLHVHADILLHSFAIDVDEGELPLYFGIGGRVLISNDPGVGVRVPFGMAYHFEDVPIELFLEVAPILDLLPATEFNMNSGLGVRYYF